MVEEVDRWFYSVILDMKNFDKQITPKNVYEEIEYLLYKCECDGIELHLDNDEGKYRKLKHLVEKYRKQFS